ncbi:hypothetical protein KI387_015644 [Taxus chinensis]|uniref:Pentatricopeptide repeat-containing protein n=1 Tax=Taxus chinensis TaxID=29808 RepID=A0AA38LG70_TAXCH|nr:hypothetical protein KI387_015644 [Taxus chinensis]
MRDKGQNRGPLWRGRLLSNEAIQAVQALRRAKKDTQKLEKAFQTKIERLLKKDLLSVLSELQRQDQCDLALQVFETVRKEMWYKPNLSLYADMIMMLGRNKLIEKVEALLLTMQEEGLKPDTRVCTEIIGSFFQVGMVDSALKTFELMKQTECHPDKSTFTVLFEGLKSLGELQLSEAIREECVQYLGEPLERTWERIPRAIKSTAEHAFLYYLRSLNNDTAVMIQSMGGNTIPAALYLAIRAENNLIQVDKIAPRPLMPIFSNIQSLVPAINSIPIAASQAVTNPNQPTKLSELKSILQAFGNKFVSIERQLAQAYRSYQAPFQSVTTYPTSRPPYQGPTTIKADPNAPSTSMALVPVQTN